MDTGPWEVGGTQLVLAIVEASPAGIALIDPNGTLVAVNPAFTALTEYAAADVVGAHVSLFKSGAHSPSFYEDARRTVTTTGRWRGEVWARHRGGQVVPQRVDVIALREPDGALTHYVAVFSASEHLTLPDDRILHLAYHDPLTGLPNRTLFGDRLKRTLLRAKRADSMVGVLFIDLDDLKPVNDGLGHAAGDALLRCVADRITSAIRTSDTASRFGGDEFVVVVDGFTSEGAAIERMSAIFETTVAAPMEWNGAPVPVTASAGASVYPRDGETPETLVASADAAMYRAKRSGKNKLDSGHGGLRG